jgi:hypothetical protein
MKMRPTLLLLAGALLIAMAGPALACRGTAEYPQALENLKQSTISPERKRELMQQLSKGNAMHEEAHRQGDMTKMGESIGILDGVKSRMAK